MNLFSKGNFVFAFFSIATLLFISYSFYFSESKSILKDSQLFPIHSVETPITEIVSPQQKTLSEQSIVTKNNKLNLGSKKQTVHLEELAIDSHVKTGVGESEQSLSGWDNELTEKDEVAEDFQIGALKPSIQKMTGLEVQTLKITGYTSVNKIKPGDPGYQNLINEKTHNSDF